MDHRTGVDDQNTREDSCREGNRLLMIPFPSYIACILQTSIHIWRTAPTHNESACLTEVEYSDVTWCVVAGPTCSGSIIRGHYPSLYTNTSDDSVLERLASFPLEIYCRWSFSTVAGASQTFVELCSLPWSSPVFSGVLQSLLELLLVCWSSSLSAGVPPCLLEFLLLPWSPFPSEFFGDSS